MRIPIHTPLFLLIFLFSIALSSQPQPIRLEQVRGDDGLPGRYVTDIFQDSRGFLWLGTRLGLVRYDGYRMQLFQHRPAGADSLIGIENLFITDITEDRHGDLWIGAWEDYPEQATLLCFDRETEKLIPLWPFAGFPDSLGRTVRHLVVDKEDQIWLGTDHGLYCLPLDAAGAPNYDGRTAFHSRNSRLPGDQVLGLELDRQGRLWVALPKGLAGWEADARRFELFPYPASLKDHLHVVLIPARDSGLWVATDGIKVVHFDPLRERFSRMWEWEISISNLSFAEDRRQKLWLGDRGGLGQLFQIDPLTGEIAPVSYESAGPDPIVSLRVDAIQEDRAGIIWIGADIGGLYKFDPAKNAFHWLQGVVAEAKIRQTDATRKIVGDGDERYWLALFGVGLVEWDRASGSFRHIDLSHSTGTTTPSPFLTDVALDAEGKVWYTDMNFGVGWYDARTGKGRHYHSLLDRHLGFDGGGGHSVLCDRQGRVWVTMFSGLYRYDPIAERFVHPLIPDPSHPERRGRFPIKGIMEDRNGYLWLGGWLDGFYRYDPRTDTFITFKNCAGPKYFHEDGQGNIWVGTEQNGLLRVDPQTLAIEAFSVADGLPERDVRGIVEDDKGRLWIGTGNGLSCYNPEDSSFLNYSTADGLISKSLHSAYKNDRGELFFCSEKGVLWFHPDEIHRNSTLPRPVLTQIDLFGKPLAWSGELGIDGPPSLATRLRLKHWQNDLTFHFSALHFKNPEKNQYQVFLENHDIGWRELGSLPQASYTNLAPGNYTLRMRAANSDGLWAEEEVALALTIRPPWWATNWAYLLYALAVGSVLYAFYFIQLHRRLEQAETRRLAELDEVKSRMFTNLTHEFRTPLTVIGGMAEQIGAAPEHWFREGLDMIKRQSRQLLHLVNQLLDLSKVEAGVLKLRLVQGDIIAFLSYLTEAFTSLAIAKHISLSFHAEMDEQVMDYDPERLQQVMSNLLSNAIKFTPEYGKVMVIVKWARRRPNGLWRVEEVGPPSPLGAIAGRRNRKEERGKRKARRYATFVKAVSVGQRAGKKWRVVCRRLLSLIGIRNPWKDSGISSSVGPLLEIQVKDTGIGIPPDELPRIFDRFHQVDGAHTREGEGTGIGLALTQELVQLMKGEITVESRPGAGSVFRVFLPVTHSAERQAPLPESLAEGRYTEHSVKETRQHPALPTESGPQTVPTTGDRDERPLLLIIEDNRDVIRYLQSCLQNDYELALAYNGLEGTEKALELIPDIIICDVMMPGRDGFELSRLLKSEERTDHIPIILLTAKADAESRLEGLETGADAYLAKPFLREELDVRLRKLIEGRRRLQAKYQQLTFETEPATQREDAFVIKVRQLVLDHLDDSRFGVSELSQQLFMSRVQLYRKLKALTGRPPSEFIRAVRLRHARELLRTTDLRVGEVADTVGFSDPSYFTRVYKETFGELPSERT